MPRTLLLADDSITIQKVVAITFATEDFKVVCVDNGEDALAKARELRPAVILADVVMPKRNGYELAQAIKSDPELSGTPVLLLAGTFEPFDPAKATASRADGHIVKPFDSQALIDKVNELIGGAPASPSMPAPVAAPRPAAAPAAWQSPAAPATPRPLSSPLSGMPQRPQPIGTSLPRPGSVPPPAAPAPGAAPARPAFAAAPIPLGAPASSAPMPLRPSAGPTPPRVAPIPLGQPMSPPPAAPLPLTPSPAAAPTPLALGSPSAWGGAATPRPPAPAIPPPARAPLPPAPSPQPIALTPAWGVPAESAPAPAGPARRDPFGFSGSAPAPVSPKPAPPASLMAEAAAAASVQPSSADLSLDVPIEYEQQDSGDGFELGGSQDLDVSLTGGSFTSGSLSDFAQQGVAPASGGIELSTESEDETLELASPHEFLGGPPQPKTTPPAPKPFSPPPAAVVKPSPAAEAKPLQLKPLSVGAPAASATPAPAPNGDGEAALRLALSQASREVIERVVWEVVPQLAEVIIREHVERLAQGRSGK